MKTLSGKELCKLLEQHGWTLKRIAGGHHVYGKPGSEYRISVPVHGNRVSRSMSVMEYRTQCLSIARGRSPTG